MPVSTKRPGRTGCVADPPAAHTLPLSPDEQQLFRKALLLWYGQHARALPWREIDDPYCTWLSEIMLQQTRVDAVLDHYRRFLARFPTLLTLALAPEDDVLALWSGLGYYRRARMLHRAARFVVAQHGGTLPRTAVELRTLPGIGAYTSAAIASIAFGEAIAVVDGNVERVLLRISGKAQEPGPRAQAFVTLLAQAVLDTDCPGDSNQAMMELGATVCLPRNPLCLQCPVFDWCRTRGEHSTLPRPAMRSAHVGYALTVRPPLPAVPGAPASPHGDILLHRRAPDLSLMAGMLELPPLRSTPSAEPLLRLRHGITGTNYYVEVFAVPTEPEAAALMHVDAEQPAPLPTAEKGSDSALHPDLHPRPASAPPALQWVPLATLSGLPLTGLARKILQRTGHLAAPIRRSAAG